MANHNVERARHTNINVHDEGMKEQKKASRKPNSNSQNAFSRLNRNGPIKSCEKKSEFRRTISKEKKMIVKRKESARGTYIANDSYLACV